MSILAEPASIKYFKKDSVNTFKNKNILITGATGGIGRVLVENLLNLGANIQVISHDKQKLSQVFSNYIKNKIIKPVICDLEKPKEITYQFATIMENFKGRLDILIMCHGVYTNISISECDAKNFDEAMNINVRSCFHLLSISVPFLKLSKGNVVILSSMESKCIEKNGFLNSVSKSMINSMVETSALELANFGVRINAVAPGVTNTDFRKNGIISCNISNVESMKKYNFEGMINAYERKVLEPQNIVDTILFLASDDAVFITGEVVQNDLGMSLMHNNEFN